MSADTNQYLNDEHVAKLLGVRGEEHGPFSSNARVAQAIRSALRSADYWISTNEEARESLDMIAGKMSRIVSGGHCNLDNYNDIAGYAILARNAIVELDRRASLKDGEQVIEFGTIGQHVPDPGPVVPAYEAAAGYSASVIAYSPVKTLDEAIANYCTNVRGQKPTRIRMQPQFHEALMREILHPSTIWAESQAEDLSLEREDGQPPVYRGFVEVEVVEDMAVPFILDNPPAPEPEPPPEPPMLLFADVTYPQITLGLDVQTEDIDFAFPLNGKAMLLVEASDWIGNHVSVQHSQDGCTWERTMPARVETAFDRHEGDVSVVFPIHKIAPYYRLVVQDMSGGRIRASLNPVLPDQAMEYVSVTANGSIDGACLKEIREEEAAPIGTSKVVLPIVRPDGTVAALQRA